MGPNQYGVAPLSEEACRILREAERAICHSCGQPVVLVAYQKGGE